MYLLALRLAELRGTLPPARIAELVGDAAAAAAARRGAARRASRPRSRRSPSGAGRPPFFLYIGRHAGVPVALEGALKLKEISYVSTDAYAAGEMKHGPIALLDERTPVVCVATARRRCCSKVVSATSRRSARAART